MTSTIDAVITPLIIIACLGIVFSSSISTTAITNQVDIITNSTWPDPNDTKYDTFFGNDPFGYIADVIFFVLGKVTAVIVLIGILIIPITILTTVPILAFPYAALYILFGIGVFKIITSLVGKG